MKTDGKRQLKCFPYVTQEHPANQTCHLVFPVLSSADLEFAGEPTNKHVKKSG